MAGIQLDGAGQAKMVTLDEAMVLYQRCHSLVEQYALSVKNNKPAAGFLNSIKRQLPALAGKLKGQFGMISDLATAVNAAAGRGAAEKMRVRGLQEGMAAIKVQLEIAITQTIAKHEVVKEKVNRPD
jgi:hypothetical protein